MVFDNLFLFIDTLAVLTVIGDAMVVALLFLLAVETLRRSGPSRVSRFIGRYGLLLMLIVAVTATSGSLYFSEVMLWKPCRFCWIQRVLMYPQVLLLGLAISLRDRGIVRYILLFSLLGMLAAGYHYYEQVMALLFPIAFDPLKPCDASGVSCRTTEILYYRYLTIPVMAFTAFALNAIGSWIMRREDRRSITSA